MEPIREYVKKGMAYVVLTKDDYEQLREDYLDHENVAEYRTLLARVRSGKEEIFPVQLSVDLLKAKEEKRSPIAVWRKYRGLTQQELADKIGISRVFLGLIERGENEGSISTLKKMAAILRVNLDDLV